MVFIFTITVSGIKREYDDLSPTGSFDKTVTKGGDSI